MNRRAFALLCEAVLALAFMVVATVSFCVIAVVVAP